MALLTITVRRDAGSAATTVWVGLRSDDALPHEHEALHRRLAGALVAASGVRRERTAREPGVG